jgi:hypothetical protein
MGKKLDINSIRQILASGDFEQLIGAIETEILECKSTPYHLDAVHQKQELAKDVSGMANAEGGVILVGVRTEANPTRAEEEITEITSFAPSLFVVQQYRDLLKSWIYPAVEEIEVEWFPNASESRKGIGAIFIPMQAPERHPFLLTRTVDENGKTLEVVFGYYERRRTSVDPMSVNRLQTLLQTGLHFHRVPPQLANIEVLLEQLLARSGSEANLPALRPPPVPEHDFYNRIDWAINNNDLEGKPAFALAARPVEGTSIPSLFQSKQAEVVQLLEHPPRLREYGFDLNTNAAAEMIEARLRRGVKPGDKLLELWRDGCLIFAARGDEQFLCWPPHPREKDSLAVHSVALIESAYLFAELSKKVYLHAEPEPQQIDYIIILKNLTRQEPSRLAVVRPDRLLYHVGSPAPDSGARFSVRMDLAASSGEIAFNIASKVFEWYSLEHDRIPFQKQPGIIDPDLFPV